jgi:hypothetical protein
MTRGDSFSRNPDTCSRSQGVGGSKSLQPWGRATARGSRRDFLLPETFEFFSRNQKFKRDLRLPQARRPSICKSLDSCSALGPRSGSPAPRNYFPAAGCGGRVESLWHLALDRRHARISAKFRKLFLARPQRVFGEAHSKKTPPTSGWGGVAGRLPSR